MKRKVSNERLAVCELIRTAFSGVRLEDGVGLMQARGLDDYADEKTLDKYRRDDETNDWSAIPREKLQKFCDALSFFDSKGMRFHLPAFMIAELLDEVSPGPMFRLSMLDDWSKKKFVDLSVAQRKAVRAFLLVMKDDDDYEFIRPHTEAALAGYWKE